VSRARQRQGGLARRLQVPGNKAEASLQDNPQRFEKWPLSPVLRIRFLGSDRARRVMPDSGMSCNPASSQMQNQGLFAQDGSNGVLKQHELSGNINCGRRILC